MEDDDKLKSTGWLVLTGIVGFFTLSTSIMLLEIIQMYGIPIKSITGMAMLFFTILGLICSIYCAYCAGAAIFAKLDECIEAKIKLHPKSENHLHNGLVVLEDRPVCIKEAIITRIEALEAKAKRGKRKKKGLYNA